MLVTEYLASWIVSLRGTILLRVAAAFIALLALVQKKKKKVRISVYQ